MSFLSSHSLCGIYCIHHFTPPSCQTDKNRPYPLIDYVQTYFPNIYSLLIYHTTHDSKMEVFFPNICFFFINSQGDCHVHPDLIRITHQSPWLKIYFLFIVLFIISSIIPNHINCANTDAPTTVSSPATAMARLLIAPSTGPSSMALAVPIAWADVPSPRPLAIGSSIFAIL